MRSIWPRITASVQHHIAMQHVQMCEQHAQRPDVNLPFLSGSGAATAAFANAQAEMLKSLVRQHQQAALHAPNAAPGGHPKVLAAAAAAAARRAQQPPRYRPPVQHYQIAQASHQQPRAPYRESLL